MFDKARFQRPIACNECPEGEEPTMFVAKATKELFEREGVDTIQAISDDDLYRLSELYPSECSVEGHCVECNG